MYISLRASLASLQRSLQNVQQKQPSHRYLYIVKIKSLRDTFQCRHSTTFPCYTLNTLPTTLTSSPTNTLPCLKCTFARRKNGHSQEPFKLENFLSTIIMCSFPIHRHASYISSSSSSSSFMRAYCAKKDNVEMVEGAQITVYAFLTVTLTMAVQNF